jgi:hypothetical protein
MVSLLQHDQWESIIKQIAPPCLDVDVGSMHHHIRITDIAPPFVEAVVPSANLSRPGMHVFEF